MDQQQAKLLKKLEPKDTEFLANGKKYFIESSICFDRWTLYLKIQPELAFGATFAEMFTAFKDIFNLVNEQNMAEIAVIARDKMKGLQNLSEKRIEPALKICALFINEENEDRTIINDDIIKRKVADWNKEGYDMGSFFQLALYIIPGCIESFKLVSQDISLKETKGK